MDWKENALNASRTLNLLGEDEINAALLAVACDGRGKPREKPNS